MGGWGGGVVRDEGNPVPHLTNVTWVRVKVSTSLLLGLSVPPRVFFLQVLLFFLLLTKNISNSNSMWKVFSVS